MKNTTDYCADWPPDVIRAEPDHCASVPSAPMVARSVASPVPPDDDPQAERRHAVRRPRTNVARPRSPLM